MENRRDLKTRLENLVSVYPFNEYEFIISTLLGLRKITLDDYYQIRDEYLDRNMFLYIFEISSPRTFGEQWAQGHLKELVPKLKHPNKTIDPNYSGQYDLVLEINQQLIRIEVKASRAVNTDEDAPLYIKALSYNSNKRFVMNFQQVKPNCCDVFVWIAVWRDQIRYWILSSDEVKSNKYYSKGQHRGNQGEGQLHFKDDNICEFDDFLVPSDKLQIKIIDAFKRQYREK
ncbi:MAG: hypothetical protein LBP87_05790 [Planctomycetaceae bacterium]|nr:hypothetical protein [Planctomycetaceae bacterium]